MLVLTLKKGDSVQIGNAIMLRILSRDGGRMRLGIAAPERERIRRISGRQRKQDATK